MIVQIIGLPCTGKTTLINEYIKHNTKVNYIDLAKYKGRFKIKDCISDVKKSSGKILVESACGLAIQKSIVVLYKQPINLIYSRHELRGDHLDEDYLSLLSTQMKKPNFTVTSREAFNSTLDLLFY